MGLGQVEGAGGGKQQDENGAGDAGDAFAHEHQHQEHADLLLPAGVHAGDLRDEDDRKREIELRSRRG